MITLKTGLLLSLGVLTVWFVAAWMLLVLKTRAPVDLHSPGRTMYHALVGFVFGFLDTLGIGNFAPTTAAFKLRGSVPDEQIPGTLNVGYALPTIAQAFLAIAVVEVEALTLLLMIAAAVLGAWLGAGLVARWPRRKIQLGMGFALLAAAGLMLMQQVGFGPAGGEELGLTGPRLWVGLGGNFVLGALMTLGVGLYAPCLILVNLLGMNPLAAFPIMMGSCAFLMPVGGARFIRIGSYSLTASLALTVAALPAVLIAWYFIRELEMGLLRWLVIVVVLYTATLMLRSAFLNADLPIKAATPEPQTAE